MIGLGEEKLLNSAKAEAEADKVNTEIISMLEGGKSFRVESGAGSGKTTSLIKVVDWIKDHKAADLKRKHQQAICITYTNAAVDVIDSRLDDKEAIAVSTIHSFAWSAIKPFQHRIRATLQEGKIITDDEINFDEIKSVEYTEGHRFVKNGTLYLFHNDVLTLFCDLLNEEKFRRIFADSYPIILIDEYQDSYKPIIDQFLKYFIEVNCGPQFGFFGDAWQTIYQTNKACGAIEHTALAVIQKSSNFRSAPRIVQLLNQIRSDYKQISAIDGYEGEVLAIINNDYLGKRQQEGSFKDDLPTEEFNRRLEEFCTCFRETVPGNESLKTLMLTHRILANHQGYGDLLAVLGDGLKNKDDPILCFFMDVVEPIHGALKNSSMSQLSETLKTKRCLITSKSDKSRWLCLSSALAKAREASAAEVLKTLELYSDLVPLPPKVREHFHEYMQCPTLEYNENVTIGQLLDIEYSQFINAIEFCQPESLFSTEHGVKGEEYDNVIFVISKGWNLYQFEKYAPMILEGEPSDPKKRSSYERNRNLFYVCCSRPRKRLVFFVTVPVEAAFRLFLQDLAGDENVLTLDEYLERQHEYAQ